MRFALSTVFGVVALFAAAAPILPGRQFDPDRGPAEPIQVLLLVGLALLGARISRRSSPFSLLKKLWTATSLALVGIVVLELYVFLRLVRHVAEAPDYTSFSIWSLAAAGLLALTSLARISAAARGALGLGFALQTLSLMADLADGGPLISTALANGIQEFSQVLCLIAYFAGFILISREKTPRPSGVQFSQ